MSCILLRHPQSIFIENPRRLFNKKFDERVYIVLISVPSDIIYITSGLLKSILGKYTYKSVLAPRDRPFLVLNY